MLNFKSYYSGSSGNLYTVDDGRTKILIEAGVPVKKIKEALGFKLSEISFALLSHSHADHSKAAKDIARNGIPLYTSQGTIDALGLSGHRIHAVIANKQYKIGDWVILPLVAIHDAPEPLSFLMANSIGEKLFFATDTAYIINRFVGLCIIAVECNYETSLLNQNIQAGTVEYGLKARLLETHMSLQQTIEFLKANDLKNVREIFLMHLSSRNANAKQMEQKIVSMFGKPVTIC